MCGRQWDGSNNYTPTIPDSLAAPQNKKWLKRLESIMARERLSKAQYQNDVEQYALRMPYNMVIPQEKNHIEWISELYNAFGLAIPDSTPPVKKTSSARDALRLGMELEEKSSF